MEKTTTAMIDINGQQLEITIKATDIKEIVMSQPSEGLLDFVKGVEYILLANDNELHHIWKEHKYEGVDGGIGTKVGTFYGNQIWVSVRIIKLFGVNVLVVEDTSTVVHHGMIREWMETILPGVRHTDANNVHHIRRHNK